MLAFVSLGIEEMFVEFAAGTTAALKQRYGYEDYTAQYFSAHVGADIEHARRGWDAVTRYATMPEERQSVRRAALEGRTM